MSNKKVAIVITSVILIFLCLLCFVVSMGIFIFSRELRIQAVSNFAECQLAGYPVTESYPRQCTTPDGRVFVEELSYPDYPQISTIPSKENVSLYYPSEGSAIKSPLNIEGEAVGSWYWEGTFRIELRSKTGDVISSTFATTQGEWMQEGYTPFSATLIFETDEQEVDLVFIKENPSAMPENDDEYSIELLIHEGRDGCVITGCSSQICGEEEISSTCEFLDHYICYRNAICERQGNGQCGWTPTDELETCIGTNTNGLQF